MKFFRRSEQPAPVEAVAPQPTFRRADVGDEGFGRVAASLTIAPGPERDARAQVAARSMEPGTAARPVEHWVLEGLDGSPVGMLTITTFADDPTLVLAFGGVDPAVRRFGMGERLFEHAVARAKELGATTLRSFTNHQGGLAFLVDHGFVASQTLVCATAPVATPAGVDAPVADGLRVEVFVDGLPEHLLDARARLAEQFNRDVPQGEHAVVEQWDAARVAEWVAASTTGGCHLVSALAFDGVEAVGFSDVLVREGDAQAQQKDTVVEPGHRGHGLGRAMKAATAREVAARFPHVTELRTFVDETNAPMLRVNEQMGYVAGAPTVDALLRLA